MTTLAKLDFHICDGSVRVTTLYLGCQISDGSMIAPRIDRDVAVHRHNTLYVGLLITVIPDGHKVLRPHAYCLAEVSPELVGIKY